MSEVSAAKGLKRIVSLDEFRGYAILGMIFVNYVGQFGVMPQLFKHRHGTMSYADTIAPAFMFVVGMGFRLSMLRRVEKIGLWPARWKAFKRYVILILVGIVLYGPMSYWRDWWDALVDIGFAGLLALPFIEKKIHFRLTAAAFYLILFQLLFLFTGYGEWTLQHSIDGGPLGPLSWAFILLMGTVAYDLLATQKRRKIVTRALVWGVGLFVAGWILKLEWPGVKEAWPYTQKGMTIPYPMSSTGLCFLTFLAFYYICDVVGFRFPHLSVLGKNALTIYVVQQALLGMHGTFISDKSGVIMAIAGFLCVYLLCYAVAWRLHKDNIIIKL